MAKTVGFRSYNLLTDGGLACRPGYGHIDDTKIRAVAVPAATTRLFEPMTDPKPSGAYPLRPLPNLIFASRWLQLPLYLGLIAAQAVYVYHFWVELVHLLEAAFGNQQALQILVSSIGYKSDAPLTALNETVIMLVVLGLIDVVMISNLLIMVIVGGYETFVSRLNLEGHPDQPEWLDHVNASVLKVKLATAIIGISSIHLLKTFINAANYDEKVLIWQTIIHIAFLFSAIAIAVADRLMSHAGGKH
ncbi:MAG: hypothetical protein RL559_1296 [Pseudomonadota bacterium]|jgi:uncharacterized protein (TIGR00645 family)